MSKQTFFDLGMPSLREPQWAVTVLQPWAWFLLRPDIVGTEARAAALAKRRMKDGENRSWAPDGTVKVGGKLFLHAGAEMTREYFDEVCRFAIDTGRVEVEELPQYEDIALRGLVGFVTFLGVETASDSPWFMGPKFWRVEGATVIDFKPLPGKQSIFDVGVMQEKAAERRRRREYEERKYK